ncbi:unnamed protein product [Heterobilharzia americana]|nr:unnamed protein product [Heterobilharzia americana]
MCITLCSFKTSILAQLDGDFEGDLHRKLIDVTTQEIENIWQEMNISLQDSTTFCWEESSWDKIITSLAEVTNEIFQKHNILEKSISEVSFLQDRLRNAFRDKISMYISAFCDAQKCHSGRTLKLHTNDKPSVENASTSEYQEIFSQHNIKSSNEISEDSLHGIKNEHLQIDTSNDPSHSDLLKQIQAEPVIHKNQQPSFLTKLFGNKMVLTPDVRPTDRHCISEILLKAMGPLWNDFTEEIDEETSMELDKNLPTVDENAKIFSNLVKTISKPFNEMKFITNVEELKFNEIPVPDTIDLKSIYEVIHQLSSNIDKNYNSKSLQMKFSQSYLMDKSKWILPFLKLYDDDDESRFRRQGKLPRSKLDDLFHQEMEKHNRCDMKKGCLIKIDDSSKKYDEILEELKSEEQKLNKLKLQSFNSQYKLNEIVLWNTGNDMVIDDKNSKYELLKKCEAKINSLKLALLNTTANSPLCIVYKAGKDKEDYYKMDKLMNTFQARFFTVWEKLKLSKNNRQHCLIHFSLKNSSEFIYIQTINKALKLLEQAAEYIENREMLLFKLAKIDIEYLNLSKYTRSNTNLSELTCSNERSKIEKSIKQLEKLIESTAKRLKTEFNYTLTFD